VQSTLQQQRLEQLGLIASIFVSDANLRAYIAGPRRRAASRSRPLEERQNDLNTTSPLPSTGRVSPAPTTPTRPGGSPPAAGQAAQRELQATGF
jgi:hypothetical protein